MSVASDNFVAAMLGAATGTKVNTYEDFEKAKKGNEHLHPLPINLDNLHKIVLARGRVECYAENNHQTNIFVMTLTGKKLTIRCLSTITVGEFKSLIYDSEKIPPEQQRLIFAGKQLCDNLSLNYYEIGNGDVVHLVLRLRGGAECIVYLDSTFRSPNFDYDFTNTNDDGITFKRGGCVYRRPVGTIRLALNVLGRYKDNNWLGVGCRTSVSSEIRDEWPVSYHGTGKHNLESIAEHGFLLSKGKRFAFGRGIYTTPNLEVAMLYADKYTYQNEEYKFIFQNRVNPNTLKRVSDSITGVGEYWISEKQEDVRPYGICVKKC